MGFGSLATAFHTRELISEVTLNESHGQKNPDKGDMCYFRDRMEYHKDTVTEEYKIMARAVEAAFKRFPDIRRDVAQADEDPAPLISKIRKIMKGAHAARNADANRIRTEIFILAHEDAKRRGWLMPATIEKSRCGIKSDSTAQFLLPYSERDKYLEDPEGYREKVERNVIKISLSGTWPAILYDEGMVDIYDNSVGSELVGLFRSETLLRCAVSVLCSPSAGRHWKYPEPGARSFASSQKESNAEINGIKKITPEIIAYISTLAVFAVHHGDCFVRNLGDIDLSELYHDVVTVLRLKTVWTSQTLDFWNSIIFGDRTDEEVEPKINRAVRFRELEAQQRRKEGLAEVGTCGAQTQVAATTPQHQAARDSNGSSPISHVPNDIQDEDASDPQTSSRKKRNSHLFDSEDEPETPRPRKKIRRRASTPSPSEPRTPQSEGQRHSGMRPAQLHSVIDQVVPVTLADWEEVRAGLKAAIRPALAAGYREGAVELTTIINMSAKKAVGYYNDNYDRLKWFENHVQKRGEHATSAQDPAPPKEKGPTSERPTSKEGSRPGASSTRPTPKKKGKASKKSHARASTEVMPPPRNTRSVTARARKLIGDDGGPLTDPEDPEGE